MPTATTRSVRMLPLSVLLVPALALAGCGGSGGTRAGDDVTLAPPTTDARGSTELTIVVSTDTDPATTWRLNCDPSGGDHPEPEKACATLQAHAEQALASVPTDQVCAQVHGGDQTARITGTWRGEAVDALVTRADGCQIARWNSLVGLLPTPNA